MLKSRAGENTSRTEAPVADNSAHAVEPCRLFPPPPPLALVCVGIPTKSKGAQKRRRSGFTLAFCSMPTRAAQLLGGGGKMAVAKGGGAVSRAEPSAEARQRRKPGGAGGRAAEPEPEADPPSPFPFREGALLAAGVGSCGSQA